MPRLIISVGSNYNDRHESVRKAVEWLSSHLKNFTCSDIYETPHAFDKKGSPYMNCVVAGESELTSDSFENLCKGYELQAGRDGKARQAGIVPIDIDVVVSDGEIVRQRDFTQQFFQKGLREIGHKDDVRSNERIK